jgi:hypothetical protein
VAKKTSRKAVKKAPAKKAPAKKAAKKKSARASSFRPPSRRTISLHKIVAQIDKALSVLDKAKPQSPEGGNKIATARMSLSHARASVESACVPNFEFPS